MLYIVIPKRWHFLIPKYVARTIHKMIKMCRNALKELPEF
jgi:hypothetical protein